MKIETHTPHLQLGKPLKAALFDLDGTLVDSVPDITEAVRELMTLEGFGLPTEEDVRQMVGHGVPKLVERAYMRNGVKLGPVELEEKIKVMMGIYPKHLINKTVLMPGVAEAVTALHAAGIPLAVVTNKPYSAARTIIDHFGLPFTVALGDGSLVDGVPIKRKPAPDMLLYALSQLRVGPDQAIMVGDSASDFLSARNAEVAAVAIRGGYESEPLESFEPAIILPTMAVLPAAVL